MSKIYVYANLTSTSSTTTVTVTETIESRKLCEITNKILECRSILNESTY